MPTQEQDVTPESVRALIDGSGAPKEIKRKAWDAFANSKSPDNFRQSLDGISLPKNIKAQLWSMKSTIMQRDAPAVPNLSISPKQLPNTVFNLPGKIDQNSVAGGAATRGVQTMEGIETLLSPKAQDKYEERPSFLGKVATRNPATRVVRGYKHNVERLSPQLGEQLNKGENARAAVTGLSMFNPLATATVADINDLEDQGRNKEAIGVGLFDAMTMAVGSKWAKGKLPNTGTLSRLAKLAPKIVDVEGVKFVVPISEAEESAVASKAGMKQAQFKKAGIGAKEFDEINRYNQAAAREVIRKVAQKTSGMTGPMGEAAGQATKQAGDAVLDAARPMYKALDAALQGPPEMRVVATNMSKAVQRAMKKVEGFGAKSLGRGSMTQPLETYLQAKSSIMDTLRQTRDPIVRRGLENALDEMNDVVEKEMKSSGIPDMYENFQEANRLWAKGKAIQRVGEAIEKATPGVPANMQNQGLAPRPPAIKPASLMQQLKKLDAKGDLTRGFGDTQKQALYKVADILDRQAPVGMPSPGESALFKAIKHMAAGPYRHTLVKIMTSPQGAAVINNLAAASIPSKVAMYSAQLSRMADSANAEKWLPGQVQPPPGAQPTTQ